MSLYRLNEDIHDVVNGNAAEKALNKANSAQYRKLSPKDKRFSTDVASKFASTNVSKANFDRENSKSAPTGAYAKLAIKKNRYPESYKQSVYHAKDLLKDKRHQAYGDYDKFANYSEAADADEDISVNVKTPAENLIKATSANNSSDLNAVKPNDEYNDAYDKNFVGDGDDPFTSTANVPAALAAKTAGGDPHPDTLHNGVNGDGKFKLSQKKLSEDIHDVVNGNAWAKDTLHGTGTYANAQKLLKTHKKDNDYYKQLSQVKGIASTKHHFNLDDGKMDKYANSSKSQKQYAKC